MPNTMAGNAMRGYVVKAIEKMFETPGEEQAELLAQLAIQTEDTHFAKLLRRQYEDPITHVKRKILDTSKPKDKAYRRHMKIDWFGKPGTDPLKWRGRWWRGTSRRRGYQPIDPIVRGGMWTALKLRNALTPRPPIRILWLCAGHHFEAHVFPRPEQITLVLQTPHEGAQVEDAGLSESGPFASSVDTELILVRRPIDDDEHEPDDYGYKAIKKIAGVDVPKFEYVPDVTNPNEKVAQVGYYYAYQPEDPIND